MRNYELYGIRLSSTWPLAAPLASGEGVSLPPQIQLLETPTPLLPAAPAPSTESDWFRCSRLHDGTDYLCWQELFEFAVSPDGRVIQGHRFSAAALEMFQAYLAGQVLSFALLKQGIESLHASVVAVEDQALGFLGDSGFGKSTLAAAFLQAGHRLVTDDLLVVTEDRQGLLAQPGPPRVKLYPEVARRLLGPRVTGIPLNPDTCKCIVPLPPTQAAAHAIPLTALFVLRPAQDGSRRPIVRRLPPRRACLDILANAYNIAVTHPARLQQQFDWAAALVRRLPVYSLSYPREFAMLDRTRDAVLRHTG